MIPITIKTNSFLHLLVFCMRSIRDCTSHNFVETSLVCSNLLSCSITLISKNKTIRKKREEKKKTKTKINIPPLPPTNKQTNKQTSNKNKNNRTCIHPFPQHVKIDLYANIDLLIYRDKLKINSLYICI